MATPETVEIAPLLAPISDDQPAGESLLYDPAYDELKAAVRGGVRTQLEDGEAAPPDWRTVLGLSSAVLARRSKDLQVAAWLTEALTRTYGFPGLRDGLRVLRGLHESFWETLHPQIEDGDLEFRAGRLTYLNESSAGAARESLAAAVEAIPITNGAAGEAYGYVDYRDSREVENLGRQDPEKYGAALAAGRLSGEQWERAVTAGRRAFYEPVYADANEALEECDRLQAVVSERFGKNAPSLLNVRKAIEDSRDLVWRILEEKRRLEPDPADEVADVGAAASPGGGAQPSAGSLPLDPRDRADAVRRLAAVAAFFKRTEPQSPVAYLVQKAMRWADMPLEAWLQEVLADETAMARVREMLGIRSGES
jgi:type VI secretion system protein ImpA